MSASISTINRTAELAALKTCAAKVLAATNGHHTRWARAGCTSALVAAGHSLHSAETLAAAMTRFSISFADQADALHTDFNTRAIA